MKRAATHTKQTRRLWHGSAVLGLGLALSPMTAASMQAAPQEYRMDGDHVAVYNLAGTVTILPGAGTDVVVNVERQGADAERLSVESGEIRGRQTLRVLYADDRIVYRDANRRYRVRMRVRSDGTFGGGAFWRGETVTIQDSGRGLEAWADLTIAVPPGQRFSLYLGVGATDVRNVDGDLEIDTGSGSVETAGTSGPLSVDIGSGSVRIASASGSLDVDTGSGNVTVEEVSGERVLLDTGSGRVHVSGIRAESVEVDTGSGGITLLAVDAPDIVVDTGSGSVELELAADVERLEVDTGSGGVTLRVPDDLGAEIEVDTGSGGIDVEIAIDERTRRRSYLRGTIGDGRGSINVDTGSGSIRVLGR